MSSDVPTTPSVTVTMSGTARAEIGDRPADIKSRRERAVLARLVAADGHVVSTDRLIDDLWNGEPPPKALGGLQVHISNLRRILEPNRPPRTPARILVSEAPGYALRLPRAAVDLWRFEDLISTADGAPDHRYAQLGAALALWQGEPFGPHATDDWARAEVVRCNELYLTAVEQRAAAALALDRAAEVVSTLTGPCERHPAREELFRLVALAQYRLGRQADALQTLRTVREYLADELGVDPSPPVRELEAAILQQDPALRLDTAGVTTPTAPAATTAPPTAASSAPITAGSVDRELAGRELEIEKLLAHADTVVHTGLRVVWITAEAGGGKSTITQLFVSRLRAAGWAAAIGHCPEVEGAPTAWPWREIVGELGGDNELDDPFLIARQIRAACESGPTGSAGTVVALDDVHRADSATLQVLRQMVAWLADRPVLVVATYRPSEAGTELMATGASLISSTADILALAGLSDDGIRALAAEVGLDPVDDATLELLRSRTDGNPLFVRELAKLVASRGARDAETAVPNGVREVLLRRVERLPDDTLSVLRLIAVSGRSADVDTVVALWPDEASAEDAVLDAIDTATVAGLLSTEGDRVWFNHVLMRDAVYDSIPTLRRRRFHWRTLEYLRSIGDAPGDVLAVHAALGASGSTAEQAIDIVTESARLRSESELAADSAALWQHAVDLHDLAGHDRQSASPEDRVAMVHALCELVTAMAHRGDITAARTRRAQALRLAQSIGDRQVIQAALTCWRTPTIWTTRQKGVADEVMTRALVEALADSTGADRARLLLTAVFEFEGNQDRFALECAREAVEIATQYDDPELRCAAMNARAFTSLGPDLRDEHPRIAGEFLAAAQAANSLEYEAAARFYQFMLRAEQNDLPGAVDEMNRAMECASGGRLGELVVVLSSFNAVLELMRGNLDRAEHAYTYLGQQLTASGLPSGSEFVLIGQLSVGWVRGSIGGLVDLTETLFTQAPHSIAWVHVVALLDAGRDDEARAIAESRPYVSRDYYWTALEVFHARALARLGMTDAAAELYEILLPWSGTVAGLNSASVAFGPMDVVLAEMAELIGDTGAAERHRQIAADVDLTIQRGLAVIDGESTR
ncbi:BTAD domain-containing putative transcriptional regulator [Gordonia sp. OPL2]|uniref:BTAD domain-containing putative transcriptional regulator n=1 Tax=Gordonia sp. OPL2 TaxID=2486274 RepID=UPI001655E058|nr:BTAD domain-containing putative transcriptional regulator [Gordonia sp. OPL2]RPA06139.1 transcriptional regulator [Gordonia sp. OPL2]